MKKLVLLIFILLTVAACGRKGALMPPEALVPAAVQDLNVQQSGSDFRITWSAPAKEQGGRPLRDLSGFRLLRRSILNDNSDCSSCPDSWKLLATVDPENPGEAVQSGSTFIYRDKGLPIESRCQYRLLVFSRSGGISSPSTSAVKKLQPLISPPSLKGSTLPGSIRLEFGFPPGGKTKLVGFNVYRRSTEKDPSPLPLNASPISQNTWEDKQVEFNRSYRYSVAALVELEGETVESLRSDETELLFTLQEIR